jgi:mRNA-degrading endonuclease RelE of RelBE toxin-antitoxin system
MSFFVNERKSGFPRVFELAIYANTRRSTVRDCYAICVIYVSRNTRTGLRDVGKVRSEHSRLIAKIETTREEVLSVGYLSR